MYNTVIDKDFYKNHAKEEWLDHYQNLIMLAKARQLPSITSVLSDTPRGNDKQNKSKTEEYALKSVEAQERLDYLHECINMLPNVLCEIINMKFLTRNEEGKRYNNRYITDVMGLSISTFYRLQNQALSELGFSLYQYYFIVDN